MYKSFFPHPKIFFPSVLLWIVIAVAVWQTVGEELGAHLDFPVATPDTPPPLGLGYFATPQFLWFYIYCIVAVLIFAAVWFVLSPHRWQRWSILGSALILFSTYFSVQISVAINNWR